MSLSMPIHEFTRLRLIAKLNTSGHISLSFKPLEGVAEPSKASWAPDLSLHFDRTCENGVGELSVYVSYDSPPSARREEALYSDPTPHTKGRTSPLLQESPASGTALSEQPELDTIWPADFFAQQTFQAPSDADDLGSNRGSIFSEQLFGDQHDIGERELDAFCSNYSVSRDMDMPVAPVAAWPEAQSSIGFDQYPADTSSTTNAFPSMSPGAETSESDFSLSPEFHFPESSSSSTSTSPSPDGLDCPASFDSDASTSKSRKLKCLHRGCKRNFSDEYIREVHMVAHKLKTKQSFPCTFSACPEVFSRKHDRLRHEVTQHGRQCEWVCHKCRKFFASEKTLKKHRCSGCPETRWMFPSESDDRTTPELRVTAEQVEISR